MMRADEVLAAGTWTGEPADSVVLEFDERYRRRFVMTGVGGLAFLLDLAEAAMLRGGDGLRLEDGRVVEVLAAPEPLAEIRCPDARSLARIAWHLGNRHLPIELTPKALRIRRDPVIEDMARGLGARVTPLEAPFNPEGGAYVQAEPSHAHAAEHVHHGDHANAHAHDHADHGHSHHGHDHHDHDDCDRPDHRHEHGHDRADERHGHDHGHRAR